MNNKVIKKKNIEIAISYNLVQEKFNLCFVYFFFEMHQRNMNLILNLKGNMCNQIYLKIFHLINMNIFSAKNKRKKIKEK